MQVTAEAAKLRVSTYEALTQGGLNISGLLQRLHIAEGRCSENFVRIAGWRPWLTTPFCRILHDNLHDLRAKGISAGAAKHLQQEPRTSL